MSFRHALVGVDGGEGGRDALALARQLTGPTAALVLGHVWSRSDGVTAATTGATHPSTIGQELLEATLRAADGPGTTAVRPAVSTAAGLQALAAELGTDLLVIGSSKRQRPGAVLVTAHHRAALHGAPCAVAVAPRGYAAAGAAIARVGVGDDAGTEAGAARAAAAALGRTLGATLRAVRVGGMTDLGADDGALVVLDGAPVTRLRELAAGVDLLVLGSRALGPTGQMQLGRTSDALLQEAAAAILVLAHDGSDAAAAGAVPRAVAS